MTEDKTTEEQSSGITFFGINLGMNKRIIFAFFFVILLLGIGTIVLHRLEGWSYVDAFYFSTVTLTTIGYGDLAPTLDISKIFVAVYAIFGVGIMLYLLSTAINGYIFQQEKHFENAMNKFNNFNKLMISRFKEFGEPIKKQ